MMHHHAAAFRAAPVDLQPAIATLALRMAMNLPPAPIAITYQAPKPIHKEIWVPLDAFGPTYPNLGEKVAKLRRASDRPTREHGLAVLDAIGALNRQAATRAAPSHHCPCASGTWHSDGHKILAAMRSRQIEQAHRDIAAQRRRFAQSEEQREAYEAAMRDKRHREAVAKIESKPKRRKLAA